MSEPEATTAAGAANSTDTAPVQQQPHAVMTDSSSSDKDPVVLDPGLSAASGPVNGVDTEEEEDEEGNGDTSSPVSPSATVVPSNTPVTADSGQGSPNMQSSSESLSDEPIVQDVNVAVSNAVQVPEVPVAAVATEQTPKVPSAGQEVGQGEATAASAVATQPRETSAKEAKKLERKEEKKKQKRKEDKGIEYILRALNSLQTPEEKLAALCKKYADLNEEHRVLQTSFKTQQRTMTVVMREKDQLQADHTRAMMAKSKLESLCRELQKHNKIIKEESIKRAKEDDEKRKEISAQFNNTIGEIQTQMNENTERNSKLRQENENLAAQLKAFINSIELRDQQVEKIQKHHELEKKLFEAKIKQAEAVLTEHTEKNNKERELLMLKLAESNKKNAFLDAQLSMYKERYSAFEQLSDSIGKYKSEMDKMTKRIKKLEKDGLQWKTKWENSNKALIEQMDARSKSEKETLTYVQKTRKLESLCRALQAELHNKKPAKVEEDA
ncbi:alpha-taxilin-like, partial [Plakobranchus ocellatus]